MLSWHLRWELDAGSPLMHPMPRQRHGGGSRRLGVAREKPGARGRYKRLGAGGRRKGVRVAGAVYGGTWGGDPGGKPARGEGRDGEAGAGEARGADGLGGGAGANRGAGRSLGGPPTGAAAGCRPPTSEREPTLGPRRCAQAAAHVGAAEPGWGGARAAATARAADLLRLAARPGGTLRTRALTTRRGHPGGSAPGARLYCRGAEIEAGPGGAGIQGWSCRRRGDRGWPGPGARGSGLIPGARGSGLVHTRGLEDRADPVGGSGIRAGPVPEARGSGLVRTGGSGIGAGPVPGTRGSGLVPGVSPALELAGGHRPAGDSGSRRARTRAGPVLRSRLGRCVRSVCSAVPGLLGPEPSLPRSTPFVAERVRGPGAPSGARGLGCGLRRLLLSEGNWSLPYR